jgi:hypothetical protein
MDRIELLLLFSRSPRKRRLKLDALFFVKIYRGPKSCPSLLESVSLRVPTR